jgi:hypothetical protein
MNDTTSSDGFRANIPDILKALDRWMTWELAMSRHGRLTKVPDCSTLDWQERTWHSVMGVPIKKESGVGLVMTGGIKVKVQWRGATEATLLAFDMDACRDPATKALSPWASEMLNQFGRSYTEITPSGAGLRMWVLVVDPPISVPIIDVPEDAPPGVVKNAEIQTFGCGAAGYVTVTGNVLPGHDTIQVVDNLDWLLKRWQVTEQQQLAAIEALPDAPGTPPSLDRVVALVQATPNGAAMMAGDWRGLGIKSASECYHKLLQVVVRAAGFHGEVAVDFLLHETAFGDGLVDSKDPDKYARESWVRRDVARVIGKQKLKSAEDVFGGEDTFDLDAWEPPTVADEHSAGEWVLQVGEFAKRCKSTRFLIYNLLPSRGLGQFVGEPSCGKTPYVISLALHVATGMPWFGHDIETPGAVLYMIGEDPTGVRDRFVAQHRAMGVSTPLDSLPLYLSTRPGSLSEPGNAEKWVEQTRAVAEGKRIKLIVVDTQNRNFGPGNENSTEDMSAFVDALNRLGARLGALVLLVHHTGLSASAKDRGRGSSVMFGALDVEFLVKKTGMTVTASPKKYKNWSEPEPLIGTLVPVVVGQDEKGRKLTAITLSETKPTPGALFDEEEHGDQIRDLLAVVDGLDGAIGQRDMEAATGLARSTLQRRIERAEELGLLLREPSGSAGTTYTLTSEGVAQMAWATPENGSGPNDVGHPVNSEVEDLLE